MLGHVEGLFDIGELNWIWKAGYGRNIPCGCDKTFRQCEFWTAVMQNSVGTLGNGEVAAIRKMQHRIARVRKKPRILQPFLKTRGWYQNLHRYAEITRKILLEVQAQAGCRLIVDSSKVPPHGLVLAAAEDMSVHVVHLVRDPRAMAFSWQRVRMIPNTNGELTEMYRMGYAKSARYWNRDNLAAAKLEAAADSYMLLRYEDLVAHPVEKLQQVLEMVGIPDANLGFLTGNMASLQPSHSISGNPMRFESGVINIRPDTEWKDKIDPKDSRTVMRITRRLRKQYGYS